MATQKIDEFLRGGPPKPVQSNWPTASQAQNVNTRAALPTPAAPAAAPTSPLRNPSISPGVPSREAQAWQASRAVAPAASTVPAAPVAPAAPATAPGLATKVRGAFGRGARAAGSGLRTGGMVGLGMAGLQMARGDNGGEPEVTFDVEQGGLLDRIGRRLEKTGLTKMSPQPSAPPGVGGGRSAGIGAEALAVPGTAENPSPQNSPFDKTADVQASIETGNIPKSLQDGRIWNSGNSYTGMNVGPGAAIVDAATGMNRDPRGGMVGDSGAGGLAGDPRLVLGRAAETGDLRGLSDLQRRQVAMLRDGGEFDAFGNIRTRQTQETLARANAGRSLRGAADGQAGQTLSPAEQAMQTIEQMRARGMRVTGSTLRALMNDATAMRNADAGEATARRGQDMLAGTARNKILAEQAAALRLRERRAGYWNQAGGDARLAAELAYADGDTDAPFADIAKNAQTLDFNAGNNALVGLEQFMKPGEDGKIPESERARVRGLAQSVVPGFLTMNERERREKQPVVNAALKIVEGINDTRNNRWAQAVGFDRSSPEARSLPDFGKGAVLEDVGFLQGAATPGVQRKDYRIRMANGLEYYLPSNSVDEEVLKLLKQRGVDVGNRVKE